MLAKNFKVLDGYIRAFDGYGKPKLNFQEMYKLFPTMTFEALEGFGSYKGFNEAFGHKRFPMKITDADGKECYLTYKEYTDNDENSAYIS